MEVTLLLKKAAILALDLCEIVYITWNESYKILTRLFISLFCYLLSAIPLTKIVKYQQNYSQGVWIDCFDSYMKLGSSKGVRICFFNNHSLLYILDRF